MVKCKIYVSSVIVVLLLLLPEIVFAGDTAAVIILNPETRNCGVENAAGIRLAVKEYFSGKGSPDVVFARDESVNDIMLIGGSTASEALFIKKQIDTAPDTALAVCVEGAADNKGDTAQSKYRIIMRILSTPEKGISFTSNSSWLVKSNINDGVRESSDAVIAFFSKDTAKREDKKNVSIPVPVPVVPDRMHSFSAAFGVLLPCGVFSKISGAGFGPSIAYGNNNVSFAEFPLAVRCSASFAVFKPKENNVSSLKSVSMLAGAGYSAVRGRFELTPHAGAGLFVSVLKADSNGRDSNGKFSYQVRTYYDPALYCAADGVMRIDSFFIQSALSYLLFFEKGNTGQIFTLSAGAGYRL
jgi:hypothetical protein